VAARCARCKTLYDDEEERLFFRLREAGAYTNPRRNLVCVACQITERTGQARDNRALTKAQTTLRFHAGRAVKNGLITIPAEFGRRYGWEPKRMAHDIEHIFENTCPYCEQPFAEMPHGLADVSVDIIDTSREPYYHSNTKWCCVTCNREKQDLSPEEWAIKLRAWRKWRANHGRPFNQDSLFGDL
jgi:hypothetical protein